MSQRKIGFSEGQIGTTSLEGEERENETRVAGLKPVEIDRFFSVKEFCELSNRDQVFVKNRWNDSPEGLTVVGDGEGKAPMQVFLLEPGNKTETEAELESQSEQAGPKEKRTTRRLLEDTKGAVNPNFSPDALNAWNKAFYSLPDAVNSEIERGVTDYFARIREPNRALGKYLNQIFPKESSEKSDIYGLEIASGSNLNRWTFVAKAVEDRQWNVTLTDFPGAPKAKFKNHIDQPNNLRVTNAVYDIFEEPEKLEMNDRPDFILASYAFDSLWLPGNYRYAKRGDKWFQYYYRVKVKGEDPVSEELRASMQQERKPNSELVTPKDFYERVFFEEAVEEVNIDKVEFKKYLLNAAKGHKNAEFSLPGGTIKKIAEIVEKKLASGGVFLNIDSLAIRDNEASINLRRSPRKEGGAVYTPSEDLLLFQEILEKEYDLEVNTTRLEELMESILSDDNSVDKAVLEKQVEKIKKQGLFILTISNS